MSKEKTNKHKKVLEHLKEKGRISSMEAINAYGATRLASIIFNLRKRGYIIEDEWDYTLDRYGNQCRFVHYVYHGYEGKDK